MHTHVSSVAKIRTRTLTLLGCLPLLVACPEDPTGGGGGETGGDSDPPEAIDPLDGEGSNPPGNPDPALVWRVPSNHGNGLAHDSRYDLQADSYTKSLSEPALSQGVDWADFVQSHDDKVRRGFRPTHVDAKVALATKGGLTFELKITDRSVYVSDDDANYRTETKTYVFKNTRDERLTLTAEGPSDPGEPRPISIDTFSIPNGPNLTLPRVGHTIVWVYDDDPVPWQLVVGQEVENFEQTLTALSSQGYRPISLASRYRAGTSEYSAIFVADGMPATDWKVMIGSNWVDLLDNLDSLWQSGFYPFRGTYEHHSEHLPTFNVLWTKRSPQLKLELRYNMDETLFNEQDRHWRQQGYYLENSCAYSDGGNTRYAGLWMRHEPYLRYEDGIPVDVASQAYLNKYEPFHTAAIQAMTMAGTDNEGEFFRPSATLYILDHGVPVLNRAYTYAPGIYPDTPVNAPMALASVAKSITAAAVVHVLDDKNIPLTAPFAGTAGINNVPSMATVPTVADVLRNLGGFNNTADSYVDHSLIDASPWGQYPITGEMMYNYVVHGGKLDIATTDSYWNLTEYQAGMFRYSNLGFTMLGELVRVQSGSTYQEYVEEHLLDPLNLVHKIHPDHAHRKDGRLTAPGAPPEPTWAGLRSYLINDAHPYNPIDCKSNLDCSYLTCGQEPCPPAPTCTMDGTCTGCRDPDIPCRDGWSCVSGECIVNDPFVESERVPQPVRPDSSPVWAINTGPVDTAAPKTAAVERYGGKRFLGGALLAAGGWHGDGASLALLMRALTESSYLVPQSVAAQLWAPGWWNSMGVPAPNWNYGLGWYVRGNWVAWAGGTSGSMAIVLHNLHYDFTVVFLANVLGNPFDDFLNPLLASSGNWSQPSIPQSTLGGPFPCVNGAIAGGSKECDDTFGAY